MSIIGTEIDVGSTHTGDTYFAGRSAEELVKVLKEKSDQWFDTLTSNSYLEKVRRCWMSYHGAYFDDFDGGHVIKFGGEQGELVNLPVNHFRNLAEHILVMVTANRPSFKARSTNTDPKSMIQTKLANSLLDYYMREKRLEKYLHRAANYAIVMGSGFIKMEWESMSGEIYDYNEETQTPIYEGDVKFRNLSVYDVAFDSTKEDIKDLDWVITRTWKNKFDIAEKYPKLKDKIKPLRTKSDISKFRLIGAKFDETVDIPVYEFYHKKTESMPDGRYVIYLDEDITLSDSPMPYRELPVYRISPSDILGTPYGYTNMFDFLPIQDAINSLYSTILTNQNAFGVQNVLNPRGSDISVSQISGGLNILDYNAQAGKPEAMNLTQTPKEIFEYIRMLEAVGETLTGVNSVARGNPEASLKSGNALALIQSQALQFISGFQQQYIQLIEDIGTGLINMLKDFGSVPRIAAIAGKTNKTEMTQFTGDDLSTVNRVLVDVGNALSQCLEKGTKVLMANGKKKRVEDIKVGDEVMGPDSKKRTVSHINSGEEEMFDIFYKGKNGKKLYGANLSHFLSLKYCASDNRYGLKKGQILDMTIKEYLTLPDRLKNVLMGFRTGVDFEEKETTIPPYILGMWLGDGDNATTRLTTMDIELEKEWKDYASSIGMFVKEYDQENNKSKLFKITSGKSHGKSDRNTMMNHLKDYNLIQNKHIPDDFKINSRENRLQLLAGLLDTDGTRTDETFIITQKNNKLSEDIVYLAQSLGFKTTHKNYDRKAFSDSDRLYNINSITIGGNTWEIPTRLERKQVHPVKKQKDWLNYGINVIPKGMGTFYGFTLEEEPHFVLGDFSVTHNTTAGKVQMAEQMLQMYGDKLPPEQYISVMETGKLESLTSGISDQLTLISIENERLVDGNVEIKAIDIDDHSLHIREHRNVLSDPELRLDGELVKRTLDHIQEHITALREVDPDLLAMIQQQPLGPEGGSPVSPENAAPGAPPASAAGGLQAQPSPEQAAQFANNQNALPSMPQPAQAPGGEPVLASDVPLTSGG